MKDPYVYKGTDILINRLNIKDAELLKQAEADITTQRLITVDDEIHLNTSCFEFEDIQKIHRYIFQDLYDWAGRFRTVNIVKPEKVLNGLSVEYSDRGFIQKDIIKALNKLNSIDWNTLTLDEKAKEFSKRIADIWKVHPFREGNTRTIVKFASQYAKENGFPLKEELFKNYSNYMRDALVLASVGKYSEYKYLEKIIKDAMEQGASKVYSTKKSLSDIRKEIVSYRARNEKETRLEEKLSKSSYMER